MAIATASNEQAKAEAFALHAISAAPLSERRGLAEQLGHFVVSVLGRRILGLLLEGVDQKIKRGRSVPGLDDQMIERVKRLIP